MAIRVHYEDDIFHIVSMIKTISSGIELDIDSDVFGDKVIEDVVFLDRTILTLADSLKENTHLIRRTEYLRSLLRAEKLFVSLLDTLVAGHTSFTIALADQKSRFVQMRDARLAESDELRTIIENRPAEPHTPELVSDEEFSFLLRNDEEHDTKT